MKKVLKNKECYNCQACYHSCPKSAITMNENNHGFLEATIDEKKCVECNLCYKICPSLNLPVKNNNFYNNDVYSASNKNKAIINSSSSGGVFSVLAKYIISNSGIVCAPVFDNDFNVKHEFVEHENDLVKLYGSKYVESDLNNALKKIKKFLNEGKLVLFSGTSCQVAGLKLYLKKEYDNLITQDLICHGVPVKKMWRKYVNETFDGEKISKISFRNKDDGWMNFNLKVETDKRIFKEDHRKNDYFYFFLRNIALKPTCYDCKFKDGATKADISLGDFWGIKNLEENISLNDGISMVNLNTTKGKKIFDIINKDLNIINRYRLKDVYKYNPMIKYSVVKPGKREEFFDDLYKLTFIELKNKYILEPSKVNEPQKFEPLKLVKRMIGKILRILKLRK